MRATRPADDKVCAMGKAGLIINADDWGRDQETTDRALDCIRQGSVTSVSAMVYMEDSERAATLAQKHVVQTGLHLNLTTPFTAVHCPVKLKECQQVIARYLLGHRLAQVLFHPGLTRQFEYAVKAQLDEFKRLYGSDPDRLDGHHHMHLCENVLSQRLLPLGMGVRRNFSFEAGEKSVWNRLYRRWIDNRLARRHRITDYFFSLPPLIPENRLERIFSLTHDWMVEVETHPVHDEEYRFLMGKGIARFTGNGSVCSESHAYSAL